MQGKWEELLVVLSKIIRIYKVILTISQEKKQILVAAKPQELEKVTKEEEILILQVGKLEKLRGELVGELMASYGIPEGKVSLAQLQEIATPDVAEKLKVFVDEFDAIMAEIVPLNELNTQLITQALGFINYNINILSQTVVGPTYAAKGQANEQTQRKVFDARA